MNQKQAESLKKDFQYTMERMESMLDVLDEYIEKADESIEKLTAASQEGGKFRDKLEELRGEIKAEWGAL